MDPVTLDDLSHFFTRYRIFTQETLVNEAAAFQSCFERFEEEYKLLKKQVLEENRQYAPAFNIFRILRLEFNEVRTHSAFLATLLDPQGHHGQRTLFLDSFLTLCRQKDPDFLLPDGASDNAWRVTTERHTITLHGNLDIVLENPVLGYLCVIENKIYAGEQAKQLQRYKEWMDSQQQSYPDQALIFLTPDGRTAVTGENLVYTRLSYRQDIANWLDNVFYNIKASPVREIIVQYRNLIQQF